MTDYNLLTYWFYLVRVSDVSIPRQTILISISLEELRWLKEGLGEFFIFVDYLEPISNPSPIGLGKKQSSPTCWIKGHRPILDRWAVGPWTYTGVCPHFHVIRRVWFEAVEHIAGQAGGQAELPWCFSSAGFLIGQRVLCDHPVSLCQHRWRPGQLHWAARHVRALINLRVSTGRILRHVELHHDFFPKASPALGGDFKEIGSPSVNVGHRVLSFLGSKFQCSQRSNIFSAKLKPVTLQIHAVGQVWRVPASHSWSVWVLNHCQIGRTRHCMKNKTKNVLISVTLVRSCIHISKVQLHMLFPTGTWTFKCFHNANSTFVCSVCVKRKIDS